jgi:hypothetical protein
MVVGLIQTGSAQPVQTTDKTRHAAPPHSTDSGTIPKTASAATQDAPASSTFPEHETKLTLDTPQDNIIVYQVFNKQSGSLVLQVPSAAQLRGIHQSQELLHEVASRGIPTSGEASASREVSMK